MQEDREMVQRKKIICEDSSADMMIHYPQLNSVYMCQRSLHTDFQLPVVMALFVIS